MLGETTVASRSSAAGEVAPRAEALVTPVIAGGLVMLAAARIDVVSGLSLGVLAGLALAPVWAPRLRTYSGGLPFVALIATCLASGLWLTELASGTHTIAPHQLRLWATLMLSLAVTVGIVLWARTMLPDATVAVLYGIGMVASTLISGVSSSNPWKGGYSMPLTVVFLGLAWAWRKRWLELLLALALAAVSAQNDSRSHFALLLLAVSLVSWQSWIRGRSRKRAAPRSILVLAGLGLAIYSFGQALILEGYLGEDTQARSAAQIEASGSIVLGGRPELGATLALIRFRPLGFGFGTLPTLEDIGVAKAGMATLNYDPNNGYVENYMFGELVKLHSIIGDTWAMFGIPGFALSAFFVWALLRRVNSGLALRNLSALMAFLVARVLWDLLFGPLYSALPIITLAIGLALLPKDPLLPNDQLPEADRSSDARRLSK